MFPEEYPHKCLMIEVKSKSLPERVMKLIENITEKEAKKLQGQYQVNIFYRVSSSITMTFNFKWGEGGRWDWPWHLWSKWNFDQNDVHLSLIHFKFWPWQPGCGQVLVNLPLASLLIECVSCSLHILLIEFSKWLVIFHCSLCCFNELYHSRHGCLVMQFIVLFKGKGKSVKARG